MREKSAQSNETIYHCVRYRAGAGDHSPANAAQINMVQPEMIHRPGRSASLEQYTAFWRGEPAGSLTDGRASVLEAADKQRRF